MRVGNVRSQSCRAPEAHDSSLTAPQSPTLGRAGHLEQASYSSGPTLPRTQTYLASPGGGWRLVQPDREVGRSSKAGRGKPACPLLTCPGRGKPACPLLTCPGLGAGFKQGCVTLSASLPLGWSWGLGRAEDKPAAGFWSRADPRQVCAPRTQSRACLGEQQHLLCGQQTPQDRETPRADLTRAPALPQRFLPCFHCPLRSCAR
jgi:hypothetical protein